MSRFADALKRARTGSVVGSTLDDDRSGEPIRFFAPGQPAVVAPWNISTETAPRPAAGNQRERARSDGPPPALQLERDHYPAEGARFLSGEHGEKLIGSPNIAPRAREQYNKLAATLHQAQLERGVKVILITSPSPREGKTLTAANLALLLSESYQRRVLLVDADLRHPMVHDMFGVSNTRGLSDSLHGQGPLPLTQVSSRLWLLTAGGGGDPMKTLTSARMRALIAEASAEFDWVLLDTAPVGLLPDARLLASMADGALLVALAGETAYDAVQRAVEALGPDRILGVVLNRVAEAWLPHHSDRDYRAYTRTTDG